MTLLASVFAMVLLGGVLLLIQGLRRTTLQPAPAQRALLSARFRRVFAGSMWLSRRDRMLLAIGVAAGFVAFLISGWPVMLLVLPVATIGIPRLVLPPKSKQVIARLEGLEEWTRVLAGVLAVGIGLEQAIIRTQRSTPEAIKPEVSELITRLRSRWSAERALRQFADDLADPTGDLIAAALISSAERRGPGLREILDSLAESVSDDVRARRQIEADRAKPRATARWVTLITLGALTVLFLFNQDYLAPYGGPVGQLTLFGLLGVYVGALLWMRSIAEGRPVPRFLGAAQ